MRTVKYAGEREELVGKSFDVPDELLVNPVGNSVAEYIERQVDDKAAADAAVAEATNRRRQELAERMEAEREAVAVMQEQQRQTQERQERDEEFRVELSALSQAVMTSGAAIVGQAERSEAKQLEWEQRHESVVAASEEAVATAQEQVTFAQATTQQSVEQVQEELTAAKEQIASLESELRATVLTLRGPKGDKGDRGLAGSGVGYIDADPTRMEIGSVGERFFGRPVVAGDLLFQRTPDALIVWRTADGKGWSQVDRIVNKQELVSSKLSVLDQSTKVNAPITIVRAGGGGGGSGGESLLANRIALNAPVGIGDTSNHGGEDIRSGEFELELRALDGSLAGRTLSLITAFNYDGGTAGPTFTEYALEGSLKSVFEIDLSMYLAAAGVPTGVTTTLPIGAQALRTSATVRPIPGVTGTGGVTRFALRGSVEYNTLATGRAYGPNEQMPSLLWHWG